MIVKCLLIWFSQGNRIWWDTCITINNINSCDTFQKIMGTGQLFQGQSDLTSDLALSRLLGSDKYKDLSYLMISESVAVQIWNIPALILHMNILWHLVTQENVPSLPQVSTPGVSASVLLAASYSDNNAIIEGLASYHSYYSQHRPGWEEDIIGEVEKIIISLSSYWLFTQYNTDSEILYLCSLDLE